MTVVYSARAFQDLQAIANYLTTQNPQGSRRVLAAIKSSIETLEFFPEIGRMVDNLGHRQLVIHPYPYLIFYKIFNDEVRINHIRHAAREPVMQDEL
jgi:toxin ParE1/3/4